MVSLEATCLNIWMIFVGVGMVLLGATCIRKGRSPIGAGFGKQAAEAGIYAIGGSLILFVGGLLFYLTKDGVFTILTPISILVHGFSLYKMALPPRR